MTDDERYQGFMARIERGEGIEATDWMPADYRTGLVRLIHMHAVSEIMGAYPEREWVPRAPTLHRKLAMIAKVQDEVGHGQLLLRVVEDLVAPLGQTREDLMADLLAGRVKFHNVFHMEAPTWADAGLIGWLVDGAAIITQGALLQCSYAPYARILRRICAEESFHMQHGESVILALAQGTAIQRRLLQEALHRWWEPLLHFFGPAEMGAGALVNARYRIRTRSNEELRQRFLDRYVPRIRALGLTVPDPVLHRDEATGHWLYTQPDWERLRVVGGGQGPRSAARLGLRRISYERGAWVREVLYRPAAGVAR